MQVGLFFGSFDPPHIGHVNVVMGAINSSQVGRVLVIPAYPRGIPTYVVLEELRSRMPEDELVMSKAWNIHPAICKRYCRSIH